jgi:hypothetical protein
MANSLLRSVTLSPSEQRPRQAIIGGTPRDVVVAAKRRTHRFTANNNRRRPGGSAEIARSLRTTTSTRVLLSPTVGETPPDTSPNSGAAALSPDSSVDEIIPAF